MEYISKVKFISIVYIILLSSCWADKKVPNFYEYSKVGYMYRIPIIYPYELVSDDGNFWSVKSSTKGGQWLSKVGLRDSIFVVYSARDLSYSSDHPSVWLVHDVKNKIENVFLNEKDYLLYMKRKDFDTIKLYDVKQVYKEYETSLKLPNDWTLPRLTQNR